MNNQLSDIAIHMKNFGLSLIGHSVQHAIYLAHGNLFCHAFGVLHAAQAGEIIIKSCIAKVDPLRIFKKLPKLNVNESLTVGHLFEAKSLNYSELPDVLLSSTGYAISNIKLFQEFGDLRNRIQHFAVPDTDLDKQTLLYTIDVIDPLTRHFWNIGVFEEMMIDEDFIDYICEGGLQRALDEHGIKYNGLLFG